MKKVLVVCDIKNWAFDRIYNGLKKNITGWQIDPFYTHENKPFEHDKYDIILFLSDYEFKLIINYYVPKEKVILAIRSNVKDPFYNIKENVNRIACIIAVSNESLKERFNLLHNKVVLAPGGVDTDIFVYKEKKWKDPIRVGWSGSSSNFGEEFRGLHIIKEACKIIGYEYKPALREDKFRTIEEMVEYYHNEIDVYVDMSIEAGRQNGLLEAGACGVPLISTPVGISKELIHHGDTGLLCSRSVRELVMCLNKIKLISTNEAKKMIDNKWSWKAQAPIFEKMFNDCINGRV